MDQGRSALSHLFQDASWLGKARRERGGAGGRTFFLMYFFSSAIVPFSTRPVAAASSSRRAEQLFRGSERCLLLRFPASRHRSNDDVREQRTESEASEEVPKGGRSQTSARASPSRQSAMNYFTRQEMEGSVRYSGKCRIGNWNENDILDEVRAPSRRVAKNQIRRPSNACGAPVDPLRSSPALADPSPRAPNRRRFASRIT